MLEFNYAISSWGSCLQQHSLAGKENPYAHIINNIISGKIQNDYTHILILFEVDFKFFINITH